MVIRRRGSSLIAYDGSRAFVQDRTGTENYSYQLLKHLSKIDNINNYIVYLRPGMKVDKSEAWPSNFEFKTINFPRLWTQVGLALQLFKDNPDILFVPAHTIPLIRKPSLKTIMTVHDLGAEYLPGMHQLKQRLYLNWITHHQLKSVTHLLAVSQATKQDIVQKIGIPEDRITVVYEGLNELKTDRLVDIKKRFDIDKEKYFLFVGTIQPRKNLTRLIEAFSLIANRHSSIVTHSNGIDQRQATSDIKLVLAGGKGWLSDEIYELPKKLGVEDKVKFLGRVSDAELVALYKGAIALAYPSLFEGFGLTILEAYAHDCPVLTSNLSSMPEVAGKGALLVDPYKTEDIARGLNLITDKETRSKLIKAGREQLAKFSWKKCAIQTLAIFDKIKK